MQAGKEPQICYWAAPQTENSKVAVFCVNREKYKRIKVHVCSEKRLAYNVRLLYAGQELELLHFKNRYYEQ